MNDFLPICPVCHDTKYIDSTVKCIPNPPRICLKCLVEFTGTRITPVPHMEKWGIKDESMDTKDITYKIMEHCDLAYSEGRFGDIDKEIEGLEIESFNTFQCSTWLLVTWWAREKLVNRPIVVKKCTERLIELVGPERAKKIIRGMDN